MLHYTLLILLMLHYTLLLLLHIHYNDIVCAVINGHHDFITRLKVKGDTVPRQGAHKLEHSTEARTVPG